MRNVSESMPLELLNCNEWADVTDVQGEPAWVGRMQELGVREGSRLKVLQKGSPCLLQIGESRLSVRSDLRIFVRPVTNA